MGSYGSCGVCGRRWAGRRECHCPSCHLQFGSPSAFERHVSSRGCVPAASFAATAVLRPQNRLFGVVWVRGKAQNKKRAGGTQ